IEKGIIRSLPVFRRRNRQRSHHSLVKAIHDSRACVWDQRNFTTLAGLETHSGSRGNVQPISEHSLAIKLECRVGLGKVIMTANLDRPVARVGDSKRDSNSILVEDDLSGCWKKFARYHFSLSSSELDCEHSPVWCHQGRSLPRVSQESFL